METVKAISRKSFMFIGFGVKYVKGITEGKEVIKGGSLFAFGKQILTIALANAEWTDNNGKPYNFKIEHGILYVRKLALGFSKISSHI